MSQTSDASNYSDRDLKLLTSWNFLSMDQFLGLAHNFQDRPNFLAQYCTINNRGAHGRLALYRNVFTL